MGSNIKWHLGLCRFCLVILNIFGLSLSARASTAPDGNLRKWDVGVTMTAFSMEDQHGNKIAVGDQVKYVVVAHDMDGSKLASASFEGVEQSKFNDRGIVYLADISGMPGLIAKFVAIPKMQEYPYAVMLDRGGFVKAHAPVKDKQLLLMKVNQLKIESLQYFSDPQEMRNLLFGNG